MELQQLLASDVALPNIPRVLALLMSEFNREEPDMRRINELFGTDPGLTARLLQLANSAYFRFAGRIHGVPEALAMLGIDQVRTLVMGTSIGAAFRVVPGMQMQQFWRYSLDTAKLCRMLAGLAGQNASAAFTAGLVHAVGELVMQQALPEALQKLNQQTGPLDLKRGKAETRLLGYNYAQVGAGFAKTWHFPQAIVDALEHQLAPFDNEAYEALAGVLNLAVWRTRAREAGYTANELAVTFPDTVGLALNLDIDMVLELDSIELTQASEAQAFL